MSTWILFLLVLIWSDMSAIRRRQEEAAKRAEEEKRRRIEEENARILREGEEQFAVWQREEEKKKEAFWTEWNAPTSDEISYWQLQFENGPANFDDEYYDEFDEEFGQEWRRYLGVPPKGGYPTQTAQFQPRRAA